MFSVEERNAALCRRELDFADATPSDDPCFSNIGRVRWFRVRGVASFWENDECDSMASLTTSLLSSFAVYGVDYCYLLAGTESSVSAFVGISMQYADSLARSLSSLFPGIVLCPVEGVASYLSGVSHGGVITGIPTAKNEEGVTGYQIENIPRGMLGRPFAYLVMARNLGPSVPVLADRALEAEMDLAYSQQKQTYFGGSLGNVTAEKMDYGCAEYLENLELMQDMLQDAMACGLWHVNAYYGASTTVDAATLGGIVRSALAGEESKPDPLRTTPHPNAAEAIAYCKTIAADSEAAPAHPLGLIRVGGTSIPLFSKKFATILNSTQLGIMCQLPAKEFPGYFVDQYVEFDTARRSEPETGDVLEVGEIRFAGRGGVEFESDQYVLPKKDLSRHALVIGITGGGKTNTSKSLLAKLWSPSDGSRRTPFLVIESAKREYWELRNLDGFEDLLVFTLGDESKRTSVRYRINPFEAIGGVSLQSHIDYLLSTFKAAFELYPPMPYVLESAVYEVYSDFGWDIVENENAYGLTEYPTLEDLHNKIDVVVNRLGYDSEVKSNVQAALKARIGSLMVGGKGAMLNTKRSTPIGSLLSKPVVMELEDIGDDETKSFVIGMLLVQLYEHRKASMTTARKDLSHLLVVEEAHRLLKNVPPGGEAASTQAKSVEFFCNLLAEIRTYGQGIMIADQIPTKLAPDSIKNTNLKIVHRTVALDDRETIGNAMNMTQEQIEYLSSLPRGYAAIYAEGDNRPKCVKMPLVTDSHTLTRAEVIAEVRAGQRISSISDEAFSRRHQGCAFCERRCSFGDDVVSSIEVGKVKVRQILDRWRKARYAPATADRILSSAYGRGILSDEGVFAEICYLGNLLERDPRLSAGDREVVIAKYLKHRKETEERDVAAGNSNRRP